MAAPEAPELVADTLARLPGLTAALERCGGQTLAEYSRVFFPEDRAPAIDPLGDLLDAAHQRAAPLLGEDIARRLREQLERSPSVLTANHHGLDTLHQSVHSTIAFALPALLGRSDGPRVLPVLACGGVPLGSATYPRGMILARKPATDDANPAKVRIPFFPHTMRTCTVNAAPPLTARQLGKVLKTCTAKMHEGLLTYSQNAFIKDFITGACLTPDILGLPSFADQAVVLNARLWPRLFAPEVRTHAPPLAYLDLERVVGMILESDLRRDSLAAALIFDRDVRGRLLATLDGVAGCWTRDRLERLRHFQDGARISHDDLRGAGTCFFWMLDESGRQLPLWIEESAGGPTLAGRSMDGERFSVPIAPEPILRALAEWRISPGLFVSYATLAMARGVRCWGGVYQAAYLREMQRGVARALGGADGDQPAPPARIGSAHAPLAVGVADAPCGSFLAGLITVFTTFPGDEPLPRRTAPACAPDIAAASGLTAEHIERISRLTMTQANTAGLLQTYEEITPAAERAPGWYGALCAYLLSNLAEMSLLQAGEQPA